MSFLTAVKRRIKRSPLGLYLVEKRKKRVYTAYLKKYDDREIIERLYRRASGGKSPDLDAPKTFTEKLQWLKLYYRDPMMTVCSDKYAVKEYLRAQGLDEMVIPTLAVYDNANDWKAARRDVPCIVKATHGSGWNIRFDGRGKMSRSRAKSLLALWLSQSPYIYGREWNYRDQSPRIMVEPLMAKEILVDYKLMCFNGVVRAVQVNQTIDGKEYVDFYDAQWQKLDDMSCGVMPTSKTVLPRPASWQRMVETAQKLASSFPFVRVDLYEVDDKIYFGEMTFFPGSGFWTITPAWRDRQFGDWLMLPPKNNG